MLLDLAKKKILITQRNQHLSFKYMQFALFVTDVAIRPTIRLVTSLSKTVAFLKTLVMTLLKYTKKARLRKRYH